MSTKFTEELIQKRIAEGYGQGELENYKPWLTVNDVTSSNSRAHKVFSWKINRIHHLLSDNEFNYFVCLEWLDEVIDIREQYPLDRAKTIPIAERIGIKHPFQDGTHYVMSTDFLITLHDGKNYARTFKPANDLENESVIKKFQIEQIYWQEEGVDWGVVTETELDMIFVNNLIDLRQFIDFIATQDISGLFVEQLIKEIVASDSRLIEVFNRLDIDFNQKVGTALSVYKCLIINKVISIDLSKPFSVQNSCKTVVVDMDSEEKLA
jgi:hypothetical protein